MDRSAHHSLGNPSARPLRLSALQKSGVAAPTPASSASKVAKVANLASMAHPKASEPAVA